MISHTVYRGRNNENVLQLLNEDEALSAPDAIDRIEITFEARTLPDVAAVSVENDSDFIEYSESDGTVTMRLGRIESINALADGVYEGEVIAYGPDNVQGIVFGSFLIYLTGWGGEIPDES